MFKSGDKVVVIDRKNLADRILPDKAYPIKRVYLDEKLGKLYVIVNEFGKYSALFGKRLRKYES